MGKLWSIITVGMLAAFLVIPVLAGVSVIEDLSPEEVGRFAHDLLHYWMKVAKIAFS